mmetsp:Transcript_15920/g.42858  ORF Transcript_15920/g.42858 Transcript_15920/m.42858 type:complete len:224 (+) Transcript_15920:502-1173(+)
MLWGGEAKEDARLVRVEVLSESRSMTRRTFELIRLSTCGITEKRKGTCTCSASPCCSCGTSLKSPSARRAVRLRDGSGEGAAECLDVPASLAASSSAPGPWLMSAAMVASAWTGSTGFSSVDETSSASSGGARLMRRSSSCAATARLLRTKAWPVRSSSVVRRMSSWSTGASGAKPSDSRAFCSAFHWRMTSGRPSLEKVMLPSTAFSSTLPSPVMLIEMLDR